MRTTIETIEIKRFTFDHYGYDFYVLVIPSIDSDENGGNWYDFYLGCNGYAPMDFIFGIQVLDHEWNDFNYNFFETYIFDYVNEYILAE